MKTIIIGTPMIIIHARLHQFPVVQRYIRCSSKTCKSENIIAKLKPHVTFRSPISINYAFVCFSLLSMINFNIVYLFLCGYSIHSYTSFLYPKTNVFNLRVFYQFTMFCPSHFFSLHLFKLLTMLYSCRQLKK